MRTYSVSTSATTNADQRSVVALAAYLSGTSLRDHRTNSQFDFSGRRPKPETTILAPDGSPSWALERQELWNAVQTVEHKRTGLLALVLALELPVELSAAKQRELAVMFAHEHLVSDGRVVDVCLESGPLTARARFLITVRRLGPAGFSERVPPIAVADQFLSWHRNWNRLCARALYSHHLSETLVARAGRIVRSPGVAS